jgi:hypothetical protein
VLSIVIDVLGLADRLARRPIGALADSSGDPYGSATHRNEGRGHGAPEHGLRLAVLLNPDQNWLDRRLNGWRGRRRVWYASVCVLARPRRRATPAQAEEELVPGMRGAPTPEKDAVGGIRARVASAGLDVAARWRANSEEPTDDRDATSEQPCSGGPVASNSAIDGERKASGDGQDHGQRCFASFSPAAHPYPLNSIHPTFSLPHTA